ncbi:hypothetical protein ACOMHN_021569 [Nucella lapillus]
MEKMIERQLDEIYRVQGMQGVICVDRNGLLLAARGRMSPRISGPVSALAQLASTLHPQHYQVPVIVVESQQGKTLIKQEEGITTAFLKT